MRLASLAAHGVSQKQYGIPDDRNRIEPLARSRREIARLPLDAPDEVGGLAGRSRGEIQRGLDIARDGTMILRRYAGISDRRLVLGRQLFGFREGGTHRRERRVHLVRDPRGETSERSHLLRGNELLLALSESFVRLSQLFVARAQLGRAL